MKKTVLRKSVKNSKTIWEKIDLPRYNLTNVVQTQYDNEYITRMKNLDLVNYLVAYKKFGTLSIKEQKNLSKWAENIVLQSTPFGSINWDSSLHVGLGIIGCIWDLLKIYYTQSKSQPTIDINRDLTAMLEMYENQKDRKFRGKDLTPMYEFAKSFLRGEK